MNAVLDWVKSNVFIVVFGVIMIAAAVTLPLFASKMNKQVKETVNERVRLLQQLSQLQKGEIIPGHQGLPNEQTLQEYEKNARILGDDAAAVQQAAIEHNRKGREPIRPDIRSQKLPIFPDAPAPDMDVIPLKYHEALVDAYGNLLHSVRAGMPPDEESLRAELESTRVQFITQDLRKSTEEQLTDEEQKQLSDKLTSVRMSLYVEAAKQIGLYVSMNALGVPIWNQASQPSHGELFTWQWQYWVVEDVLKALQQANSSEKAILQSPVKHVLLVQPVNVPAPGESRGGGGAPPAGGGGMRGMGEDVPGSAGGGEFGEMGSSAPAAAAGAVGGEANPKAPVQPNYAASLTGRVTNPLYDVINVQVIAIVETRRLPEVLDAIAKYNFMTVTSMYLKSVDQFESAQGGFFYGTEPVAQVEMMIETVWLRAWTREFIPGDLKATLGIPAKPAQAANTDA